MAIKKDIPGPDHYQYEISVKNEGPAYTLKERPKTSYFDPSKEVLCKPSPNKYNIKEDIVKSSRY